VLTDPRVFDEDHVPRRLLHREGAVETLVRAWDPVLAGEAGADILVVGPSGVGKTVAVRHTLDRLQDRADVDVAYVRTMGESTAGVLRATLKDLGGDPHRTTPTEDLAIQLREHVTGPTIVVCDEADDLLATDALDRLSDVEVLSIVAIAHDADAFLARCDGRVRDRFCGRELHLERYGGDELADILAERARRGLTPRAWERADLKRVADQAAGVARVGIQTLRAAAEIAADQGYTAVSAVDVDRAHERAQTEIRAANLASLPFHHQVLYELVREAGELRSVDLHDRYDGVAESVYRGCDQTPIGKRARRNKLAKLQAYDLVNVVGENRDRVYRPCDETIHSPLEIGIPL